MHGRRVSIFQRTIKNDQLGQIIRTGVLPCGVANSFSCFLTLNPNQSTSTYDTKRQRQSLFSTVCCYVLGEDRPLFFYFYEETETGNQDTDTADRFVNRF